MGRVKDWGRRCVSSVLALVLISGVLSTSIAHAEESSATGAEKRAASMINFFRDQGSLNDMSVVTHEDLFVFSVFASNFFIPGETRLGDFLNGATASSQANYSDTSDIHNLAAIITERFFGSANSGDNFSSVANLLAKSHQMLIQSKGFSGEGNFYLSKDMNISSAVTAVPITGSEFIVAVAEGYTGDKDTGKLYCRGLSGSVNSKTLLDFTVPAWKAVWKIVLNSNSGFFGASGIDWTKIKAVFMDGFGNFWMSNDNASSPDEYILLLPACLNPIVHNKAQNITASQLRLPIANSFVMGNFLAVGDSSGVLTPGWTDVTAETVRPSSTVPLYNLMRYQTNAAGTSRIQIFGVDTALPGFGSTDTIFETDSQNRISGIKNSSMTYSKISEMLMDFVDQGGTDGDTTKSTYSGLLIASTYKGDGNDPYSRYFTKDKLGDSVFTTETGYGITSILFDSLFIPTSCVEDTMYYFDFNNSTYKGSIDGVDVRTWESDEFSNFGVPSQRMFYTDSTSSAVSHYLPNSYIHSPSVTNWARARNPLNLLNAYYEYKTSLGKEDAQAGTAACIYGMCVGVEGYDQNGFDVYAPVSKTLSSLSYIYGDKNYAFMLSDDGDTAIRQAFGDKFLSYITPAEDPAAEAETYKNTPLVLELLDWRRNSATKEVEDWANGAGDMYASLKDILKRCVEPYDKAVAGAKSIDTWLDEQLPPDSLPHALRCFIKGGGYLPYGRKSPSESLIQGSTGESNWVKVDGFALPAWMTNFWTTDEHRYQLVYGLTNNDIAIKGALKNYTGVLQGGNAATNLYFEGLYNMYTLYGANPYLVSAIHSDMYTAGSTVGDNTININIANRVNMWPGIFWSYMRTILNLENTTKIENGVEIPGLKTSRLSNNSLPDLVRIGASGSINLGDVFAQSGTATDSKKTMQEMQEDIVKKVYGLLSETESTYRNTLIKSTTDGWVVSTHRAITGAWASSVMSVSTGTSNYQGVVGYINTPTLRDIPLTSWVMDNYMLLYVFLLLLVVIVLLLMFFLNIRTLKQCAGAFAILCVALLLPNILINGVVNLTNKTADSIYSERFNYWALVQHMQSVKNMSSAAASDNTMDVIIAGNMEAAKNVYSTDAGVRVKWMAPKRDGTFANLFTTANRNENMSTNLTLFRWLFSSFLYQEEFVYTNDKLITYLYRPYNAVANEAISLYDKLSKQWPDAASLGQTNGVFNSNQSIYDANSNTLIPDDERFAKFIATADTYTGATSTYPLTYSVTKFLDIQHNRIFVRTKLSNLPDDTKRMEEYNKELQDILCPALWCLQSDSVTQAIFQDSLDMFNCGLDISGQGNDLGLETYLRYSESPFYYFYNTLKYNYGANGDFARALLNSDVFKQSRNDVPESIADSGGKTKDFLDMESLFTYVIPYLEASNDYVIKWTGVYGTDVSGYDFSAGAGNIDPASPLWDDYNDAEQKKASLEKVWNMYSPWVDALSEIAGANAKAKIADKTVYVADPLNPASYEAQARPMIFGESDMYMKGYRIKDLTDVEVRIQRVLDATYKDMMYLVNYYDFDDDVLITAAAMMATFNFNKEFSDTGIFGNGVMLYPQGFEMKNFNYDAFMRLALLNATGESLFSEKDLYVSVMSNTSIFTGILLLMNDLVAVIGVPMMKLLVLLFLLFLGLIMCVACVITPPEQMVKSIFKAFALPCIAFAGVSIGFSFAVSLLVGEGLTTYVGSKVPSLTINDPSLTILAMLALGIIYMILLFKILKMIFKSLKTYGMASVFASLGVLAGAGTLLANTALKQGKRVAGKALGVANKTLGVADTVAGGAVGAVAGRVAYGKGGWKDGMYESAESGLSGMYGNYMKHRARKRGADEYADSMHRLSKEDIDKKSTTRGDGTAKKKKEAPPAQSETKSYTPPVQKPKEKEVKYKKEEGREFVESKGTADESLHTPESRRETQHHNDTGVVDMSKVRFVPTKERPTTLVVKKKPNRAAKVVVLKPTEKKVQRTDRDYSDGNRN